MTKTDHASQKLTARPSGIQEIVSRCLLLKSFLSGVLLVLATFSYYVASGRAGPETVQWLAKHASIIPGPETLAWLASSPTRQLDADTFRPVIVSYHPLIIILENFLNQDEATHLGNLAQGRRNTPHTGESTSPNWRKNSKASLSTTDAIVQNVMLRASRFQGLVTTKNIQLQVVRYATGQQEKPHYDQSHRELPRKAARRNHGTKACQVPGARPMEGPPWHGNEKQMRVHGHRRVHHKRTHHHGRRKKALKMPDEDQNPQAGCHGYGVGAEDRPEWETTISVVLEATCGGGCGTQFPMIHVDWSAEDDAWCDLVDCDEKVLTIKAKPGNAIFWKNIDAGGGRDDATLHASLPVPNGNKVELNIWVLNGMPAV